MDAPATEIENMASDSARKEVGIATVVNQLSPTAADGAVYAPVTVQVEDTKSAGPAEAADLRETLVRLPGGKSLASIFNDLAAPWDIFGGEHSRPVNPRGAHLQAKTGEANVNGAARSILRAHATTTHAIRGPSTA